MENNVRKSEICKAGNNEKCYYDKSRKRYRIYVSYKVNNKTMRKAIYGKSKKEAIIKRREFISNLVIDGADIPTGTSLSFEEAITRWLKGKRYEVRDVTYDKKESVVLTHLIPYFEGFNIEDIKYANIKSFVEDLTRTKTMKGSKNIYISYNTAKKIYSELKSFFKDISEGEEPLINKNPTNGIKFPKEENFPKTKSEEDKYLTVNEMKIFISEALTTYKNGKYKYNNPWIFVFLLNTGLRPEEVIALKKDCYFRKEKLIVIKRTFVRAVNRDEYGKKIRNENGHNYNNKVVDQTKTRKSSRSVFLNNTAIIAIENSLKLNPNSEYLFANTKGNFITGINLTRTANKIFANCPDIKGKSGAHCFRHSMATAMYDNEVALSTISGVLGHSSTRVTEEIYAHKTPKVFKKAMETLEADNNVIFGHLC